MNLLPRHRTMEELEGAWKGIRLSPSERGTLEMIVRRPKTNAREVLELATLDPIAGLTGDDWLEKAWPRPLPAGVPWNELKSEDLPEGFSRDTHLTLMNARAIAAISGEREYWPLAGDQLYVDFDLRGENLPPGARLQIGEAEVEISAEPHTGCRKFSARFGSDALRFVNSPAGREWNLRGIYAVVIRGGAVRTGDPIQKLGSESQSR